MKLPLSQLVIESLEFSDHGLRWQVRPRSHFFGVFQWAYWNQKNAGRLATETMNDEDGVPYCYVTISSPEISWTEIHVWVERVRYILDNGEDHPDGELFGGFFNEEAKQ